MTASQHDFVTLQGASSPKGAGRNAGGGGNGGGCAGGGGVGRPRFDNAISVMENFEASEIRRLLRWANYCMTDALQARKTIFGRSSVDRMRAPRNPLRK